MKNPFPHYTNDYLLINANQKFIAHEPWVLQTGYKKSEQKFYSGDSHGFIVDWQVPDYDIKANS